MYRITRVLPGQEVPVGRIWRVGSKPSQVLEAAKIYLSQECLSMDGRFHKKPQEFCLYYGWDSQDSSMEETGSELYNSEHVALQELVVLYWDEPPMENEFGRVSP